ncbi:MAG: SGNH/GDSL hydrolase family protein [Planctomycetota bacterium]
MAIIGPYGYLSDYILWVLLYLSVLVHTWSFFRSTGRRRQHKRGVLAGNSLILACLIGLIAFVSETYLRFFSVALEPFGVSLPARRWFARYAPLNSWGYRDAEWTNKKLKNVRRIAFVGDSFTFGWGIERPENRFSNLIQAKLEGAIPGRVEVLNVSKPGWDTEVELPAIKEMVDQFGADEIVLGYVFNDIEKLLPRSNEFDPVTPPEPGFFSQESSCLLDYLYRTFAVPRLASVGNYFDWLADGYADSGVWSRHEDQLGGIIAYCRERQVSLRVVLLPFLKTRGDKFQIDPLHKHLRSFFESNQVPVVDLREAIAGNSVDELVVNRRDAHPNEKAHALFGEMIWKAFYAE